jgi:hypothetical protein
VDPGTPKSFFWVSGKENSQLKDIMLASDLSVSITLLTLKKTLCDSLNVCDNGSYTVMLFCWELSEVYFIYMAFHELALLSSGTWLLPARPLGQY